MKITELRKLSKDFAYQLLSLVDASSGKMQRRSEATTQPSELNINSRVGFMIQEEKDGELGLYADVLAKSDESEATFRISGIVMSQTSAGEDLFNSVTMFFSVDEKLAHGITHSAAEIEIEDLKSILSDNRTELRSLRHSNSKDLAGDTGQNGFFDLSVDTSGNLTVVTTNQEPIEVTPAELSASVNEVLMLFRKLIEEQ